MSRPTHKQVSKDTPKSLRRRSGGRIIQTSSSVGQAPYAIMGIYAVTKWGSMVSS